MANYGDRKGYLAGNKKCIHCGLPDRLSLLNPTGECRGGVEGFYYRCGACNRYFVEYWINGKLKTVLAS
ncbi:MAG: hypothetical protein JSU72_07220 [Deltaproteobacteria bacterium]|nr:MAG: hypothetical protein JSU72_07220 [Deltaproteobacteria bacterium]